MSCDKLKLLFIADGRSPIALNWMQYFVSGNFEVHLVSTYPCNPGLKFASLNVIPVAFGELAGDEVHGRMDKRRIRNRMRGLVPVRGRSFLRHWLGSLSLPGSAKRLDALINLIRPDLVHAMRIPFEGMLASRIEANVPLLISVWGNDFTLHAASNPWMASNTRLALKRADALHTDCQRDVRLAGQWGFALDKGFIVLPTNGGVKAAIFFEAPGRWDSYQDSVNLSPVIINPRGIRAYLRNDTFFKAIPAVLARYPKARFLCPSMQGEPQAEHWVDEYDLRTAVELLPNQSQSTMGDLFRKALVAVSPSTHDGTPNTLLEAMACGCFPIAGDLESIREWITHGENGYLVDPGDPQSLADAILSALEAPDLMIKAAKINTRLITERAEYKRVMEQIERFYRELISY